MKYGLCSWVLPLSPQDSFEYAYKKGFEGIAVEMRYDDGILSLSDDGFLNTIVEKSNRYNMKIPALALNFLCDIAMIDKVNENLINDLISQCIDIAHKMKIDTLQIPSFFESDIKTKEDFVQTAAILKHACYCARRHDIKIGWENALDTKANIQMMDIVDSSAFFIYFDTQNPVTMGGIDNVELAENLKDYVRQVHLKDSKEDVKTELILGDGITNFERVASALKNSKSCEWVLLESEYKVFNHYDEIIKKDLLKAKSIFG